MPQPPTERPCRRCGVKIKFITGPNGRLIPVHQVKQLYNLVENEGEEPRLISMAAWLKESYPRGGMWVSHFETCPHASQFSKGRQRADQV
jgi:hypothetical protein